MHNVVQKVEKHNIPHSLIINADQTPSKYVPVGWSNLAEKNVKDVPIFGSADKRSITAFFLPFQLIYKGKITQSLQKMDSLDGFSLSVNEKHFSNTQESNKFLKETAIPFVDKKSPNWKIQVKLPCKFRGQKTTTVLDILKENNIITEYVPNNITNYYQLLDCTTNGQSIFSKQNLAHGSQNRYRSI